MALVIAGDRSGVGKTTVTLALLSFLRQQGYKIQSFKVGPDYIDPMFHTAITNRPCRNLDPILTSEDYVRTCFSQHSQGSDAVIVEGVMGLFDGVEWQVSETVKQIDFASTAHIARLLNLPILLVIDSSRLSGSIAALVQGYAMFDPNLTIAGIILNRVASDRHLELLQDALSTSKIPILGVLRRQDTLSIRNSHLGLVPAEELPTLKPLFDQLAYLAKTHFNWSYLLPLLSPPPSAPLLPCSPAPLLPCSSAPPARIAVARDRAFNFYYQDNLDILEQQGATLIPWSPLVEATLPEGTQGLYFGGGFPEMFAAELSANQAARKALRKAIAQGMPTYAECGGLMYLCQEIIDFQQQAWSMVGSLPTVTQMGERLTIGYRQATTHANSPFLAPMTTVWGHEFHRSYLTTSSQKPLFSLKSLSKYQSPFSEGWQQPQLHASYLHLHFGGCLALAQKFVCCCLDF